MMFLYASSGDNIRNFAKTLIEVNKVADNRITGVFNDINLWVKDGYTEDVIVEDYYNYVKEKRMA